MEEDLKKEIEEIIGQMQCPKDFVCYKSGFETLCRAKEIGVELFLQCLEETPQKCKFSVFLGRSYLCQCPLRFYIFKKLKK
jgi:hypothetical protein